MRLVATFTLRLALLYLALFVVSVLLILGLAFWFTGGVIARQTAETVSTELAALREEYGRGGLDGLSRAIEERRSLPGDMLYLLTGPDLRRIAGNLSAWPAGEADETGWLHFNVRDPGAAGAESDAQAVGLPLPGGHRLLVGRDMRERQELLRRIGLALGWAVLVTLGLGVAGGVVISRSVMRRIDGMNRTLASIRDGRLQARVQHRPAGDEFDQLAGAINAMLDRIEQLMTGMRQVTDNIAHDLRTPLTRLRSRVEMALAGEDPAQLRAALQQTLDEADRLLATFTALLAIAEAEAGTVQAAFRPVDLPALAKNLADLYEPFAEESGLRFQVEVSGSPRIAGHDQLLTQMVANLLDNAVKYTPAGGTVRLSVADAADGGSVTVADSGPGIPADQRDHVLERFVRLESSRSSPGNGLGLSLVAAVARLHGARLELADNRPGLSATIHFPPMAAAAT